MKNARCDNCVHWIGMLSLGVCRRNPPVVIQDRGRVVGRGVFPSIEGDQSCGEFKDKHDKPRARGRKAS